MTYNLNKIATFYLPVICDLSDSQMRYIAENAKVGGHTLSHQYLTETDLENAENEIKMGKERLEEIIGKEVKSFCYPRGRYNDRIKKLVRDAGFEEARTTRVLWTEVDDPYEKHTTIHVYPRSEYNGRDWFEVACEKLEHVQKNGGIFHIWGHSWEIDKFNQWDKFEAFLKKMSEVMND